MSGWAEPFAGIIGPARCQPVVRLALALAAGAVAVAGLPPASVLWAMPLALSTLFVLTVNTRASHAALAGFAFGLGFFGVGLSWIAESFFVEAERFGALALPAVAGLAGGLALFSAAACGVFARLRLRGLVSAVAFAGLWTMSEWLRGHMLTGFPWNLAGYALADHAALRQLAAWVGSYGLSFLVAFAAALPGHALLARGRTRAIAVIAFAALVLGVWGVGRTRLDSATPAPAGVALRIIQGNVAQGEKWDPAKRAEIVARYLDLSWRPGSYDLLLWPETAFPGYLDEDDEVRRRIARRMAPGRVLLAGAPDRVRTVGGIRYLNTVQAYDADAQRLGRYAKHHLVPFGEYVPLPRWLAFPRLVEGRGDFSPGPGPRTLTFEGLPPTAIAICYEIVFPGHVVDRAARPGWIFNATNDAWFGTSIGPYQHLAAARMRAVEEGLPVVRAANTGVSAVIDPHGRTLARLGLERTGILDAPLPAALPATPYARLGDWTLMPLVAGAWMLAWTASRHLQGDF